MICIDGNGWRKQPSKKPYLRESLGSFLRFVVLVGLPCLIACKSLKSQEQFQQEIDSLLEANKMATEEEQVRNYTRIFTLSGDRLGRDKEKLFYARKAKKIALKTESKDLVSETDLLMAFAFNKTNSIDSGLYYGSLRANYLEQRLAEIETGTAESILVKQEILRAYLAIAHSYQGLNDYQSSVATYQRALEVIEEIRIENNPRLVPNRYHSLIYLNLANLYFQASEYQKASHALIETLEADKEDEDHMHFSATLLQGNIDVKMGYPERTIARNKKYIEQYGKQMNKSVHIGFLRAIADAYVEMRSMDEMERYKKGIEYMEEALWIAIELNMINTTTACLESLTLFNEKIGNYTEALKYQKSIVAFRVAEFNSFNQREIGRIEARYEADAEIRLNRLKYEEELKREKDRRLATSIGAGVLLILLIIGFWNLRLLKKARKLKEVENQKLLAEQNLKSRELEMVTEQSERQKEIDALKKERLNNLLDYKRRQLTTITVARENLNNQLRKVYGKLTEIKKTSLAGNLEDHINEIIKMIKPSLNSGQDWGTFQKHFESVHPKFFANLKEVAPNLTENELKHCAYVQMKLTNKEVANMHGISPDSVKMARNRIKKKLSILGEESLSDFLESQSSYALYSGVDTLSSKFAS